MNRKNRFRIILNFIMVLLVVACNSDVKPEKYSDTFLGMWIGMNVGNQVVIHVHSKKTLQIEYPMNGIVYQTNYSFNEDYITFEKPYQVNKIKRMSENELEFEIESNKKAIPLLGGIIFYKSKD